MENNVILTLLDDCIEESRWIKRGDITIEAFDYMGKLWPLYTRKCYSVDLDLQQLEVDEPRIIYETKGRADKIDETFAYYLYGYVKGNVFHVGDFRFNFLQYNDYNQYEGECLKFKADRINVEFLKELPNESDC